MASARPLQVIEQSALLSLLDQSARTGDTVFVRLG